MSDYVDKAQAWDLMADRAARIKELENEVKYLNARCNSYAEMCVREQKENERLRAVLEEIVHFNDTCQDEEGIGFDPHGPMMSKARSALKGGEDGGEANDEPELIYKNPGLKGF